jgi:hypothetical protein
MGERGMKELRGRPWGEENEPYFLTYHIQSYYRGQVLSI